MQMLKNWNPEQIPEKEDIKVRLSAARTRLYELQMALKEHKIPVIVLFEGWGASGKGSTISKVIKNIDPRFFKVATMSAPTEEDLRKPFLYRYFREIPEAGKFTFLDSGWMDQTCRERMDKKLKGDNYSKRIDSIRRFERQLTDNGYVLLKFFMQIDRKDQEKRMGILLESKDTRWRVNEYDLWQNDHYKKCRKIFDQYMQDTNTSAAPWYIVDAGDRKWAELQVLETMISNIEVAMENSKHAVPILQNVFPLVEMPRLSEIPLDGKEVGDEEYKAELKELQAKLGSLHNRLYRKRVPVIITYEGPKGGPGMQEMLYPTSFVKGKGIGKQVAMLTDGRYSGGSSGLAIGHIAPEAANKGPIALIKNGDIINIDIPNRTVNVELSDEELAQRRAELEAGDGYVAHRDRKVSQALKAYAAFARSADKGATRDPELIDKLSGLA